MKKQQGFTLIELVIVIVILGILAATALPRFADLTEDAEAAARDGVLGGVRSASAIAHAQAIVDRVVNGDVDIEGVAVTMVNGYPDATDIIPMVNASGLQAVATDGTTATWTIAANCTVTYVGAASVSSPPTIDGDNTGCNP